jgi:hypothetical protein
MLTARDIMAAKIAVQLGFVTAPDARAELKAVDSDPTSSKDVVNRLTDAGRLDPKQIELVRHRAALYEHVRSEASYVRSLERLGNVRKEVVAEIIAGLEKTAFRKRLGPLLVAQGKITRAQDELLVAAEVDAMQKDDARVIERYRKEDFAGVARGLIPGSKLAPEDFKISTLFRGKETRALVDKAELKSYLERVSSESAERAALPATPAPAPPPPPPPPPPVPVVRDTRSAEERVRSTTRVGDYAVVEVLGIGGMGAVYLGQRDGTGEFCAIKVMLNERATVAEKGRFLREIELTPTVKHVNVISMLGSGTTLEGMTYFVVPALAGKDLRALIEESPSGLSPEVATKVFAQVFAGLDAMHRAGILHRDLKPENIFILAGGDHEVRIMDLGLAKRIQEREDSNAFRTIAGEIVGSPAYIAPETVQSDPIDGRTDLYSVGVMLFEALTGKRPIDSTTMGGFLTAHMICPPLTLGEARPERKWPPEVESFLARLLGKTRDERPASAAQAREELLALWAKLPPVADSASAAPPVAETTSQVVSRNLLGRLEGQGTG